MEYSGRRILGMHINTLFLLSWACFPPTDQQNTTDSSNFYISNHVNNSHERQNNTGNTTIIYTYTELYYVLSGSCLMNYTYLMSRINNEHFCDLEQVLRPYSILQKCLEDLSDKFKLHFPNEIADNIILDVHRYFFLNCTLLSEELMDPPEHVLLALIISPICLIPFLVTLVVCKSKTSKSQT
ncbi:receptor activity-modifying protein 2 isoform X2 [Bombina bombina]|uniref:receptor activity-modifying protein 2 isoform X2 n=1 Tax=Bombina bombina TaxID=8345 RepID=UPI00235B1FB3|nr:receptor activity-modifying protein 2 isoform X2 [Bombina bombina]